MSKYTEAMLEKESFVIRCESSLDYHRDNESLFLAIREELEDARIDLEALQIADRLEQADAKEIAKHIECNDCTSDYCTKFGETCGRVISTMLIIDKALTYIRGDTECQK